MKGNKYQQAYSATHSKPRYNRALREQKTKKVVSVLEDYYSGDIGSLFVLDVGSSTGFMSNILSKKFGYVVGVDVDRQGMVHAQKNVISDNIRFILSDAMNLGFDDDVFDVVVCSHIYEHVPDPSLMLSEIYRVLKPDGMCLFVAGNRLALMENHYRLPLLSVFPKWFANYYLRVLDRGDFYYETLFVLSDLRDLVSMFEVIDYTLKLIEDPIRFGVDDMVENGSLKQSIALWVLRHAYWLCPTYVWLLHKKLE